MKPGKQFAKFVCVIVSMVLILQLAGCGTIIYPERRGQTGGRIDVGIAILDAVGLLFFIIPGLVAFGVDFTTGAIYLPGGHHKSVSPEAETMTVVRVHPRDLNNKRIEEIVKKHTGCSTRFSLNDAEVYGLEDANDVAVKLAELRKSGYRTY
jgi:hypothetical protein